MHQLIHFPAKGLSLLKALINSSIVGYLSSTAFHQSIQSAASHKFFKNFKTPTQFPANPTFIPYKE
jgi:hypothetical protein